MAESDPLAWVHERAAGEAALLVCAHGAGGHRDDGSLASLSKVLLEAGISVVRFNFEYRAQGSKRPDPMPRLKARMSGVVEEVRARLAPKRLLIGGRSMGGRAATMLAAEGFACDGLMLFAYPLHPAGQPEKLRAAHLPKIRVPVICFSGTRDSLCTQEIMKRVVPPAWTLHWLEGADHSFRVLKSSGRTDADVRDEVRGAAEKWVRG